MIKTLKTNWRELVALLVVAGGVLWLNSQLDWIGGYFGDPGKFAHFSNFLIGFAKFCAANFCGAAGVLFWPSINKVGNETFPTGWAAYSAKEKTTVYIAFTIAQAIIGALCFA